MKKKYILGAMLMGVASFVMPSPVQAEEYDPVYDFSGFNDQTMLNLFYNALQQGRNYPTIEEFQAAGIQPADLAFIRSHVRKAPVLSFDDRINKNITYDKRALWMNTPLGIGKKVGGQPSTNFNDDVFSMWNYTNLFGFWNYGIFSAAGCCVDAAHRNGTDIMTGIKFFDHATGSAAATYSSLIRQKNADGTYKYAKPLINCLMYLGHDGINYNWESTSEHTNSEVVGFHRALYQEAAAQGFDNFHICHYTNSASMSENLGRSIFGTKEGGRLGNVMLNYQSNDIASSYNQINSVNTAESLMGTAEGLYAGVWIVTMDRTWTNMNATDKVGICLWGEHAQSRFFSYNVGSGAYDVQANYQRILERGFSGGNRNPANLPPLSISGNNWTPDNLGNPALHSFAGMAYWIPERSAIQGNLPFVTHFVLGNGDRYYYKGKETAGSWYNMGAQDLVPTYRWLIYNAGTTTVSDKVEVNYTHTDAYIGGSCIELSGQATSTGTDIILYKTKLSVEGAAAAKVAVKNVNGAQPTDLYVILRTEGSNEWKEYAVGATTGATWEEKTIDLASLADGAVIDRIGLRVKGNTDNYKLLVGKLGIYDQSQTTPANVKDLTVEVKQETKKSMTIKAFWNVDAEAKTRADWDLLYNDEANIHHFELLYKNGEDGRIAEVGRTSSWSSTIGNVMFDSADDEPYFGVRSVSTDQKTYSPVVWVKVPRANQADLPDGVEKDSYGTSQLDINADGAASAREGRYLTQVFTTGALANLNYRANAPVADGTQYADARDKVLKVKQGQNVTLFIKAAGHSDGLKYCYGGGWIDFNCSGDFDDHPDGTTKLNPTQFPADKTDPLGEMIFKIGNVKAAYETIQSTGVTINFTVPQDATPGSSRLRMVFSDAWFDGAFTPSGLTNKGFTIDFGVEISGTNPGRVSTGTRDLGIADEPEGLGAVDPTAIETVETGDVSKAVLDGNDLNLANVEKAWVYTADGKLVRYVNNDPTQISLAGYTSGAYIIKMQHKNVIRSQKVVLK